MTALITAIVAIVSSSGVATIIVTILQHRWEHRSEEDTRIAAIVEAQKVLLIDRVRFLGKSYLRAGEISLSDKENLYGMYDAYKALGGNGHLETVMNEVAHLEVKGL
jgi:hypothetical protein